MINKYVDIISVGPQLRLCPNQHTVCRERNTSVHRSVLHTFSISLFPNSWSDFVFVSLFKSNWHTRRPAARYSLRHDASANVLKMKRIKNTTDAFHILFRCVFRSFPVINKTVEFVHNSPCWPIYPFRQNVVQTFSVTRRVSVQFWGKLLGLFVPIQRIYDWLQPMSRFQCPKTESKKENEKKRWVFCEKCLKLLNDKKK